MKRLPQLQVFHGHCLSHKYFSDYSPDSVDHITKTLKFTQKTRFSSQRLDMCLNMVTQSFMFDNFIVNYHISYRCSTPGGDSHIKRTRVVTVNFEKNPSEKPRSCFVGVA